MKLTVDCILNSASPELRSTGALAQLLALGNIAQLDKPLAALICEQYGLIETPDYPIAAISAKADGLNVAKDYWLRADPVHLVLQRDCFSLGEPVPLQVAFEHAERMIASLNQHFNQDGVTFALGSSGAWYLRAAQFPQIKTTLPDVAAGKNIHQFLPQGADASRWLAVLNEVQMLLHEHPANAAREALGEAAVNSIWLSGGGLMPQAPALQDHANMLMANGVFYQGLASWTGLALQALPNHFDAILQNTRLNHAANHIRLQLPVWRQHDDKSLDDDWFYPILMALKNRKIKTLRLNLGFYEKTLRLDIAPIDIYKFWRSPLWRTPKPVMDYLQ